MKEEIQNYFKGDYHAFYSKYLPQANCPNPDIPLNACPGYLIELIAGGNVIASDNNSLYPAAFFLQSNITYTASSSDPYLGLPLQINLISNGVQTNFDNVSLQADSVPIPSAAWLLGLGLIGLVGIRRKFWKV